MRTLRIVHASGSEFEVEVVRLTPRTVAVESDPETPPKVFSRTTGSAWGFGQGWRIADADLLRLRNEPASWKRPVARRPMPDSWHEAHASWQPEGGNVTDMPLAQLRHLGYVDTSTIERDDDGDVTFDYSDKGWENFTQEDFERFPRRNK